MPRLLWARPWDGNLYYVVNHLFANGNPDWLMQALQRETPLPHFFTNRASLQDAFDMLAEGSRQRRLEGRNVIVNYVTVVRVTPVDISQALACYCDPGDPSGQTLAAVPLAAFSEDYSYILVDLGRPVVPGEVTPLSGRLYVYDPVPAELLEQLPPA